MPQGAEIFEPVLLFDGECGLCQRVVRLLLWLDRRGRLRFAPLQGPSAQSYLGQHGLPTGDFESMVFVADWARRETPEFALRTAAALAALRQLGGGGRASAAVLVVIPAAWRDAFYRLIARQRRRFFGVARVEMLARAEWAGRFLD
jgi:predicted DCC family thiol-disulfide oxidoreductase YuxK